MNREKLSLNRFIQLDLNLCKEVFPLKGHKLVWKKF